MCALVSCFVFEEKTGGGEATRLSAELSGPLRIMQDTARRIAKVIQSVAGHVFNVLCILQFSVRLYICSWFM